MKVYRSKSDQPKKRPSRKAIVSIGVSIALVAAALVLTLTLTLGKGKTPVIPAGPDDEIPAATTPVYVMPVSGTFELGKQFANDKLVLHKTFGWYETHEALDLLVESGREVKAIFDGTVLSVAANTTAEGTVIRIQHEGGIVSTYKGLAAEALVETGDTVTAGDVIGTVGVMPSESRDYNQTHLHLEVTKNGKLVDPLSYLPEIGDK